MTCWTARISRDVELVPYIDKEDDMTIWKDTQNVSSLMEFGRNLALSRIKPRCRLGGSDHIESYLCFVRKPE